MGIIPYEYFVNENTFNIFTDASIIHRKIQIDDLMQTYYFGSPGADIYLGDRIISSYNTILPVCTNNQSEITAIEYGVNRGCKLSYLYNISNINIFSDSKICIYGLREWIFNWMNTLKDGVLYNTSGDKVANQSIFISIIQSIVYYNKPIRFYHIRGHFNASNFKERKKFNESFMKENHINDYLDERLIDFFISANDSVDTATRNALKLLPDNYVSYFDSVFRNISEIKKRERIFGDRDQYIRSIDLNKYKQLIGGN